MANTTNTFGSLKKNSKAAFTRLTEEIAKMNTRVGQKDDDRFWQPKVDKTGNGFAVIRFLPAPPNEDIPFVRLWAHAFQGPGGWYIENSLTTIGQDDPVSEYNSELWNSGVEANKDVARKQKRNLIFISNIFIVKDPANSDNEGKVFLYKYGKKIYDKLNEAMNPQDPDEKPMNPFDIWGGANFSLKIGKKDGYRNYDSSRFKEVGPLLVDDKKLEEIWKSEHSLQQFIAADQFKPYNELKARLIKVLKLNGQPGVTDTPKPDEIRTPRELNPMNPNFSPSADEPSSEVHNPSSIDDDLKFFNKLANDDSDIPF